MPFRSEDEEPIFTCMTLVHLGRASTCAPHTGFSETDTNQYSVDAPCWRVGATYGESLIHHCIIEMIDSLRLRSVLSIILNTSFWVGASKFAGIQHLRKYTQFGTCHKHTLEEYKNTSDTQTWPRYDPDVNEVYSFSSSKVMAWTDRHTDQIEIIRLRGW